MHSCRLVVLLLLLLQFGTKPHQAWLFWCCLLLGSNRAPGLRGWQQQTPRLCTSCTVHGWLHQRATAMCAEKSAIRTFTTIGFDNQCLGECRMQVCTTASLCKSWQLQQVRKRLSALDQVAQQPSYTRWPGVRRCATAHGLNIPGYWGWRQWPVRLLLLLTNLRITRNREPGWKQ
jgi:hypothetical protein